MLMEVTLVLFYLLWILLFEEGPRDFVFRPGIRNNGIAGDAIVYPMFTGIPLN